MWFYSCFYSSLGLEPLDTGLGTAKVTARRSWQVLALLNLLLEAAGAKLIDVIVEGVGGWHLHRHLWGILGDVTVSPRRAQAEILQPQALPEDGEFSPAPGKENRS